MKYKHHTLIFEIPDSWLKETDMLNFKPQQKNYLPDLNETKSATVEILEIESFEPLLQRHRSIGVFCKNNETPKQRVSRILNWLKNNTPIEPIGYRPSEQSGYKYKLAEGSHRFHAALAMGYTHVPAIQYTYDIDND
jgi:hypothetical protein